MLTPDFLSGAPVASFVATAEGLQVLGASETLRDGLVQFSHATDEPEAIFARQGRSLGIGGNSDVREIDGIALKASTPTTGRLARRYDQPIEPEDLTGQHTYLRALAVDLADRGHTDIVVPEQYFALRGENGGHLLGQQAMTGWLSLPNWVAQAGYSRDRRELGKIYDPIKGRLVEALGNSVLRSGLVDLGLGRNKDLRADNVLVPGDSTNPADAPLCVIDLPSRGLKARFGIKAARKLLSE